MATLELELEDTLTFGKYKGSTVDAVLCVEPSYIEYLINETGTEFSEEVLQQL